MKNKIEYRTRHIHTTDLFKITLKILKNGGLTDEWYFTIFKSLVILMTCESNSSDSYF